MIKLDLKYDMKEYKMSKIILASGSPRRKELLSTLGYGFEVMTSEVDETLNPDNDIIEEIEALSFKKALAVFKDHRDKIVIGSDTMVTINGRRLGKPKDEEDAFLMLKELSNNTHEVVTAVSIISASQSETFSSVSKVKFAKMSDEEIREYIATKEPMDKAGAYAIQGLGSKYIQGIVGDYYSIMGLPVCEVYHRLQKYLD